MIDYKLLSKAQDYYRLCGYEYIEVPWLVSQEINDITRPIDAAEYVVEKNGRKKSLIASGEQGFLYLMSKGHLAIGKAYQTITPCIRNDNFDETHVKYFMKLELIQVCHSNISDETLALDRMVDDARQFMKLYIPRNKSINIFRTVEGYDLMVDDIEVGSYGIRSCKFGRWIYGTGLAEPRFSRLIKWNM